VSAADTIYALSSGQPPAGIAIVRISGSQAGQALRRLAGRVPRARRATLAKLRAGDLVLDHALTLFFPGPASATGDDVSELHLHGGRAVVSAVLAALAQMPGLREAEPGEFTRRALENGRIDLIEAEGLADLLEAETESQRRAALLLAGGVLGDAMRQWTARLLDLAAAVEARLDFSDEGDVEDGLPAEWDQARAALASDIETWLQRPPAERLKEGLRVVIAGPPNAGKSTLLNALAGRAAAITSAIPGTTRDLIEVPVAIAGMPFLLIDSAGIRDADDEIEAIGVGRAQTAMAMADLIIWLGDPAEAPPFSGRAVAVRSKSDLAVAPTGGNSLPLSAVTGEGMAELVELLTERARQLLPREGEVALHQRHRVALSRALEHLHTAGGASDLLLVAEELRQARRAFDTLSGATGVDDMLDALFSRFCIGK
jgi:tRNA modification GTPase